MLGEGNDVVGLLVRVMYVRNMIPCTFVSHQAHTWPRQKVVGCVLACVTGQSGAETGAEPCFEHMAQAQSLPAFGGGHRAVGMPVPLSGFQAMGGGG